MPFSVSVSRPISSFGPRRAMRTLRFAPFSIRFVAWMTSSIGRSALSAMNRPIVNAIRMTASDVMIRMVLSPSRKASSACVFAMTCSRPTVSPFGSSIGYWYAMNL